MRSIISISIPEDLARKIQKIEASARRESKKFSRSAFLTPVIMKAYEDYFKMRGDGNPQYGLDHWYRTPNMQATPALFRSPKDIEKFLRSITPQRFDEVRHQVQRWEYLLKLVRDTQ